MTGTTTTNWNAPNNGSGYCTKMTIHGKCEDVYLFIGLCMEIDRDFPYRFRTDDYEYGYAIPAEDNVCKECRGVCWNLPHILPRRLRVLAKQCGCLIKIRQWAKKSSCRAGRVSAGIRKHKEHQKNARITKAKFGKLVRTAITGVCNGSASGATQQPGADATTRQADSSAAAGSNAG